MYESSEVVLQAARSGGWLAYRPDATGGMQRADLEEWAQTHVQAAGRVDEQHLADRYSWLDETGKPTMHTSGKAWQEEAAELGEQQPVEPAEPEADCLNLDAEVGHFDCQEDYQAALVALLHPSRRQDDQMEQQLTQLGWYQEELAKLHGEAGKKAALDKQQLQQNQTLAPSPRRHELINQRHCQRQIAADGEACKEL